jgi:predicted RNase H-like nuclease
MKWVNPPVAFMLHAGVPALRAADVDMPGLRAGDATRVALEGYPGLVARALIARRSYKSDTRAQQTPERLIARKDLVDALEQGRWRGLRLKLTHAQRDDLVADPQGDKLDAALCLLLAGWADAQPGYGMPADIDPLEGWIVAADGHGAAVPVVAAAGRRRPAPMR